MGEFYFSSRKVKLMVLRGEEAELKLADFFFVFQCYHIRKQPVSGFFWDDDV